MNKMTQFVFVILISLNFVSFPCEGLVSIVNDTKYVLPGDDVRIEWSITNPVSDLTFRAWNFVEAKELLASINNKDELTIDASSLSGIKVEKPSTLILENVDEKYNGTYSFQYNAKTVGDNTGISHVTVIVQANATILINCSSSTIVDEDSDVRCLCEGKDGNPPAKVRWYDKDGTKIGVEEDEEKLLTLNNVDGTYNGTYKCVARSHTLTPEKSIEVKVLPNFQPKVIEVTVEFRGESVIITCVAIARPSPTRYIILHNGKERYNNTGKTLTIQRANDSDSGLYTCIAWNKLGESPPKSRNLTIPETRPTTTPTPTPTTAHLPTKKGPSATTPPPVGPGPPTRKAKSKLPIIIGTIIGVLALIVIVIVVLWFYKKKQKEGHRGNAIVNSGNNDPSNAYESVNDCGKAGGDKAGESTSGNPPANANTPVVYATVDKNRKNEPAVTYATLDTMAMQPNGSKRETEPPRQQTEYASIQFKDLKGDLV